MPPIIKIQPITPRFSATFGVVHASAAQYWPASQA
jgi:hypothetical protein